MDDDGAPTPEVANTALDLRLEGKDAEAAGRALARQWHPRFLYDVPARHLDSTTQALAALGLDVRVTRGARIPHRTRVAHALDFGTGAGVVPFHGVPALAIGGLPPAQPLAVTGERLGAGDDRWREVTLEIAPAAKVVRSLPVGEVGVDQARLMFVDACRPARSSCSGRRVRSGLGRLRRGGGPRPRADPVRLTATSSPARS